MIARLLDINSKPGIFSSIYNYFFPSKENPETKIENYLKHWFYKLRFNFTDVILKLEDVYDEYSNIFTNNFYHIHKPIYSPDFMFKIMTSKTGTEYGYIDRNYKLNIQNLYREDPQQIAKKLKHMNDRDLFEICKFEYGNVFATKNIIIDNESFEVFDDNFILPDMLSSHTKLLNKLISDLTVSKWGYDTFRQNYLNVGDPILTFGTSISKRNYSLSSLILTWQDQLRNEIAITFLIPTDYNFTTRKSFDIEDIDKLVEFVGNDVRFIELLKIIQQIKLNIKQLKTLYNDPEKYIRSFYGQLKENEKRDFERFIADMLVLGGLYRYWLNSDLDFPLTGKIMENNLDEMKSQLIVKTLYNYDYSDNMPQHILDQKRELKIKEFIEIMHYSSKITSFINLLPQLYVIMGIHARKNNLMKSYIYENSKINMLDKSSIFITNAIILRHIIKNDSFINNIRYNNDNGKLIYLNKIIFFNSNNILGYVYEEPEKPHVYRKPSDSGEEDDN